MHSSPFPRLGDVEILRVFICSPDRAPCISARSFCNGFPSHERSEPPEQGQSMQRYTRLKEREREGERMGSIVKRQPDLYFRDSPLGA